MTVPLCLDIPPIPDPMSLLLPGGIEIEDVNVYKILQPALTPLVPLFDVVDTVVALYSCVKAIPDALGPPPDPTVLAACLPELSKKVAKLLRLVPQLSVPAMILGMLRVVIETLKTVRRQLQHLEKQEKKILGVVDRASKLRDAGLMAVANCARANVAQEAANVGKSLASLGRLLGLIDLFMGMVGGPKVPALSSLGGVPLKEAIAPLDELIRALEAAKTAVPVP